jgi:hypothetical protein
MSNLKSVASEFEQLAVVEKGTIRASLNHPQTIRAKELLRPVLAEFAEEDGNGQLVVPKITPELLLLSLLASTPIDKQRDLSKIKNLNEAVEGIFASKADKASDSEDGEDGAGRAHRGAGRGRRSAKKR